MAPTLVDSEAVGFADGNAGHVYTFPAGAPSANDLDVLCINSNTVVSTPSGFTARVSAVANQGAYIFTRKASGGEGSTVTITTSGDHNTTLTWSRWTGTDAYSSGSNAQANNSNNTVLPALSTGTLAATGMLVVAFGALHNHDGALATSPSWINSWTAMEAVSQGAAGSSASCVAFTAYKTNAGTAAETIDSVSWTNNVRNRYALYVAFTATAGGTDATVTPSAIAVTVAVPAAAASAGSRVSPAAIAATTAVPAAAKSAGSTVTPTAIAATAALPAVTVSTSGSATPTPATIAAVVALPAVTRSAGSTATPATIAATSSLPTVAPSASSTVTPATVAATATLPASTTAAAATVTPAAIAAIVAVPAVSLVASSTVTPDRIAVIASLPLATVHTVVRDLQLALGAPQAKWYTFAPGGRWQTGNPEV